MDFIVPLGSFDHVVAGAAIQVVVTTPPDQFVVAETAKRGNGNGGSVIEVIISRSAEKSDGVHFVVIPRPVQPAPNLHLQVAFARIALTMQNSRQLGLGQDVDDNRIVIAGTVDLQTAVSQAHRNED